MDLDRERENERMQEKENEREWKSERERLETKSCHHDLYRQIIELSSARATDALSFI